MKKILYLSVSMTCLLFALSSIAAAAVDKVICVPWQGDVNKQHTALRNVTTEPAQLKGVIKTSNTSAIYYKWVFGDGNESGITTLSGKTMYNVETTHVYTVAVNTPITAKLQVSNTGPNFIDFVVSLEDSYLLKIENDEINARINIAIDKGLWWLYKNAYSNNPVYGSNVNGWINTYDGSTAMAWYQSSYEYALASPTASAIHAFGINGHKIKGNPDQDPYVEAVQFGMNYLMLGYLYYTSWPELRGVAIGVQPHGSIDNPDTNGNGYGIDVFDYSGVRPIYQGGQIMDAIIASGVLPTDLTGRDFAPGTLKSHNWTFGEVLQDMTDMHAWGQSDDIKGGVYSGSWWYGWNSSSGDNSASQWAAIGMIPAEQPPWNIIVPSWVKSYNANWLEYSKCSTGADTAPGNIHNYFGYNGPCGCAGDSCFQTTTSGMVQMDFVGQTTADTKWVKSQLYIADHWYSFLHNGSTWEGQPMGYGWYSFAKAMRLSLPTATTQIVKSTGTPFDWYYGEATCTNNADCRKGLAKRILEIQDPSGFWNTNLTDPPLSTAWMIITLRPTLFASAPIACFLAAPNPSYPNQPITFDPSCSGHSEAGKTIANLTKFEWDWNNDGVYDQTTATPMSVQHSFACTSLPCTYPVTLRVTDDSDPVLTATAPVNINITNPPHPPVANAGGSYTASTCSNDSLVLDGSKSFDQDQGQHESGCTTCPDDTITAWDWDLVPPLTFETINKSGKIVALGSADIASFFTIGSQNIGLRVTDNTALAYPGSGQPNLTNAAFGTVDVKSGCICNLAARAKLSKIQLTWTSVAGAASYDVYRSTAGPNTGFVKIASSVVTAYPTYLDSGVVVGTKYYYRVTANAAVGAAPCGSNAASATPTLR